MRHVFLGTYLMKAFSCFIMWIVLEEMYWFTLAYLWSHIAVFLWLAYSKEKENDKETNKIRE